ncbi:MAG: hypothetical protein IT380_16725 [Myxococcales bacterium]|nr:hypothetical protein [Myxococcales bacterium]
MIAVILLALAQAPRPVATVDFRGHAPAVLQSGLEALLPPLHGCLAPEPPPNPRRPAVRAGPSEVTVEFVVAASGAVESAKVPSWGAFVEDCVRAQLLRTEFGLAPRAAGARSTFVTATLSCTRKACRWSWMPAED